MPIALRFRPSLRLILIGVNLFLLLIPISSIYAFRLYENALIRETESELIAQGAYISALYSHTLADTTEDKNIGDRIKKPMPKLDAHYKVITPTIDLAHTVVQFRRPDAYPSTAPVDASALEAAARIAPIVQEAMLTTLAGVRVTDERGTVILGAEEMGLSLLQVPEVRAALDGRYTAALRRRISDNPDPALTSISRGSDVRVFVAMPITRDDRIIGSVLLSRSPRSVVKALYDDQQQVMIAGMIVIGLMLLMAWLTSRTISRPIHALIAQAQRVTEGEQNTGTIRHPITKELALLSQNIAQMAETIQGRADYIRNFAAHVSHEFKTPLTAIQGAIELIQEHEGSMPPEQQKRFLENITKDTSRLAQLVSRLLDLARADVMQATDQHCALDSIVAALRSDFPKLAISAETTAETWLPLPTEIARSILGTLLENSQQHGADRITIRSTISGDQLELTIEDNGGGISSANAEKLFTPFFTTKRERGGTGLGLTIARALLNAHDADICYKPTKQGTCFIIITNPLLNC